MTLSAVNLSMLLTNWGVPTAVEKEGTEVMASFFGDKNNVNMWLIYST